MTANNTLENRLIEKVKKLSVEQIQQVESFIDALSQENTDRQLRLVRYNASLSLKSFNNFL